MCKRSILIVDDNIENIKVGMNILSELEHEIIYATDGKQAIRRAERTLPDLILLDIMMPNIDGYKTCKLIKKNPNLNKIPVLFLSAKQEQEHIIKGFEVGGVDYILKPFNSQELLMRVKTHLNLHDYGKTLEKELIQRSKEIKQLQGLIIEAMGTLAEYRDNETGGHIKRTQNFVKLLAQSLKNKEPQYTKILTDDYIQLLYESAPLHDIGKVAIRDSILLKPSKLDINEFELMKKHTDYGFEVIQNIENKMGENSFLTIAKEIAGFHHERWDGKGYPNGLKEEEIPLSARIMAVADVYDALISKRIYKKSLSHDDALEIILSYKGKQFEPVIVEAFFDIEKNIYNVSQKYQDN
jgi:putative two-component system response regulator